MNVFITSVVIGILVFVQTECKSTPAGVCLHGGHVYQIGESFQPSICQHCYCTPSGHAACAITDCFFTTCVDAVHDPKQCCPTCPNGSNCKAPDGHIIQHDETYHMDAHTICSCNTDFMMFGSNLRAVCAVESVQKSSP